jgi:hypothetical protein
MSVVVRVAQGLLVVLGGLVALITASVYADTGSTRFPDDANALVATSGIGLGVLVVVLATAGIASGERWAWLALWVLPAYLIAHVALLGTWVPDAVLAVLAVVALVLTRPRYHR